MQPRARPIAHLCTHIRIMLYPALSRDHLPVNHSSERRELARHGIAWELVSSFLKIAAEFSLHACMPEIMTHSHRGNVGRSSNPSMA